MNIKYQYHTFQKKNCCLKQYSQIKTNWQEKFSFKIFWVLLFVFGNILQDQEVRHVITLISLEFSSWAFFPRRIKLVPLLLKTITIITKILKQRKMGGKNKHIPFKTVIFMSYLPIFSNINNKHYTETRNP